MMYMNALPFLLVEDPSFWALFAMVAPALRLPSRHKLSGPLLDQVHGNVRKHAIVRIKAKKLVSIVTDGWSDTNRSSIINFVVVAPGMPSVFWTSIATGAEKHTGEYVAEQLEAVLLDVENTTKAKVVGILTDNASAQIKAWEIIERQPNRKSVLGGGCAAQGLNLIIEDVFKNSGMKKVKDDALEIISFVRDHYGLLDEFRKRQKKLVPKKDRRFGLRIPVPTRWYSIHASLRSLLENRLVLEELFVGGYGEELVDRYGATARQWARLKPVMRHFTEDTMLWDQVAELVALLEPVVHCIRALESDKEPPSRVYERFKWLLTHRAYADRGGGDPTAKQKLFVDAIEDRWKFIHTNAMGIAFLLDPTVSIDHFLAGDKRKSIKEAVTYAQETGLLE
jgi:hypothetical protein